MKIIKKAILPKGFQANGISCGLKRSGGLDLSLMVSSVPAKTACMFTVNTIPAAPVILDKEYYAGNKLFRAIIANSGNANCFTGKKGLKDAQLMSESVAAGLGIKKEEVLVASTGIIGKPLDIEKITRAVPGLITSLSARGIDTAKKAIMTTDTFSKEITARLQIGGQTVTVSGIAKGAGMIAPDMATMFVFLFTDALVSQSALEKALRESVDGSFNRVTVDGCMSTNDTVILMANGLSGNAAITGGKDLRVFTDALNFINLELAKMLVLDGEGASKFIEIKVKNARTVIEAKKVALQIANSNLFKCAMYGENPNFGRIVASVGASGIDIREQDLKIKLGSLKKKKIDVEVRLSRGDAECVVYTSDLTPRYIKINAEYS
ncbi:MAG: bifunctional glutamate N-acetyltransferase/amino-acid acetyltransferase ArgJ [Candidatus Omnitrophica bacterium]|nr:bifunctional glutamate N-acetyltransferase/amino-acid acetyltransferase ArgJ [Candidatus Omnitrophota bacterium]